MTPKDSLQAMHLSEDFHAELFAAEPDVMSPVEMAFDENGKVYVAEMFDYPDDPPAGKPARSRIRVLENLNGDGKTWRSSIFAENVLAVSGFMPWKGGLIVTSAPDILFLKDTNGDGKADLREVLYTGFPKVNQEARITNPRLGVITGSIAPTPAPTAASRRPATRRCSPYWCAVRISGSIRSAERPKRLPARRSSAPPWTTSTTASSRRTPPTYAMSSCP